MTHRLDMTFTYDDGYQAFHTVTQDGTALHAHRSRVRHLREAGLAYTEVPFGIEFTLAGEAGPVKERLTWIDVAGDPDE